MDPVSAIGVAAAALQFFGVAVKATTLLSQIRDNAESATDYNKVLEASVRELRDVQTQLTAAVQSNQSSSARRITGCATKCQQESDELIKLLEEVRRVGKNPSMLKNLFRAIKDRRRIQKLEKSLQSKKEALHEMLQHDTWRLSDEQERGRQEILEGLAQIQLTTNKGLKDATTKITKHQNQQFAQAEMIASKRHEEAMNEAQNRRDEENAKTFLQTLFFTEIVERQGHISGAAPGTLEWIFETDDRVISDGSDSDLEEDISHQQGRSWDDLAAWLRNDNDVYWINGKAGSGKSTLVAHIVEDPRTRQALDLWCGDQQSHIISYFFWRAGTTMQKSIVGLLQSLLYQICSEKPKRIKALMSRLSITPSMMHTWTEKLLKKAFHEVINIAKRSRFCVFIDGLDEFTGDYSDLVNLIFELEADENVKFCVSSRPEVQLSNRLSSCKTLRLQDLTLPDITRYTSLKFSNAGFNPTIYGRPLHERLARMAEGVFLWAVLVTQSLIWGFEAGDDEEVLLERLEAIPQGLDDLFKSMLGKVDKLHRKSLAFYLQALTLVNHARDNHRYAGKAEWVLSIANLTASRVPSALSSLESFETACEQTKSQIIAQSAGLLEIHEVEGPYYAFFDADSWNPRHVWLKVESSAPFPRRRQEHVVEYPKTLRYETIRIDWVHRSAFDFICDPDNAKDLDLSQATREEILRQLYSGFLALLISAPSTVIEFSPGHQRSLMECRLELNIEAMHRFWKSYTQVTREATDRLRLAVTAMDCREMISNHKYGNPDGFPPDWAFWSECAVMGHWGYIFEHLDKLPLAYFGDFVSRSFECQNKGIIVKIHRTFRNFIINIFNEPHFGCQVRLLWTKHVDSSWSISYNVVSNRSATSFEIEKYLADSAARTVASFCYDYGPKLWDYWRDIIDKSGLYIEIARANRYLYIQVFAFGFCTAGRDSYEEQRTQPGGFRIICFPWRKAAWQQSDDIVLEDERFLYFETCRDTTRIISQYFRRKWDSFKIIATLGELETCHRMIIDDAQANEQHLDATEQTLVLECLQIHLWDLLKSIWRETDSTVADTSLTASGSSQDVEDHAASRSGREDEAMDHQNDEKSSKRLLMKPYEEDQLNWVADDEDSKDWVTDDTDSIVSTDERI